MGLTIGQLTKCIFLRQNIIKCPCYICDVIIDNCILYIYPFLYILYVICIFYYQWLQLWLIDCVFYLSNFWLKLPSCLLRGLYWQKICFFISVFMQLCVEQLLYRIKLLVLFVLAIFFCLANIYRPSLRKVQLA